MDCETVTALLISLGVDTVSVDENSQYIKQCNYVFNMNVELFSSGDWQVKWLEAYFCLEKRKDELKLIDLRILRRVLLKATKSVFWLSKSTSWDTKS